MSHPAYQHVFLVGADHACLPGHFPGSPLVPGVVLLEQVALALRDWRGQRLSRVLEAKFVAPLLPEQEARVALTEAQGRLRFEIHRGDDLLARGSIEGTI